MGQICEGAEDEEEKQNNYKAFIDSLSHATRGKRFRIFTIVIITTDTIRQQ
jgi:hypothetical protein